MLSAAPAASKPSRSPKQMDGWKAIAGSGKAASIGSMFCSIK
jgi:hypothetical protein